MHDLSGVRILVPFPNDSKKVKALLKEQFGLNGVKETFWGLNEDGRVAQKDSDRFVGYRATHYHVTWKQPSTRYNSAALSKDAFSSWVVEVQVTTMLMNS